MNEKQEKKRRYNLRLEFIAHFNKWLDSFCDPIDQLLNCYQRKDESCE